MRIKVSFQLTLCVLCLVATSCFRHYDVLVEYNMLFTINNIKMEDANKLLFSINEFNNEITAEGKAYYEEKDTLLAVVRIIRYNPPHSVQAIDLRLTDLNITALENYDENHPKGTSLNDILNIKYKYKDNWHLLVDLTNFTFGDLMLIDYNYWEDDGREIFIEAKEGFSMPQHFSVKLRSTFGQSFYCEYPEIS